MQSACECVYMHACVCVCVLCVLLLRYAVTGEEQDWEEALGGGRDSQPGIVSIARCVCVCVCVCLQGL